MKMMPQYHISLYIKVTNKPTRETPPSRFHDGVQNFSSDKLYVEPHQHRRNHSRRPLKVGWVGAEFFNTAAASK